MAISLAYLHITQVNEVNRVGKKRGGRERTRDGEKESSTIIKHNMLFRSLKILTFLVRIFLTSIFLSTFI